MTRLFLFFCMAGLLAGCSTEQGGTGEYDQNSSGSGVSSSKDVGQGTDPAIKASPSFNPGSNIEDPRSPNHFTPQ
jgi:hypothetical protein